MQKMSRDFLLGAVFATAPDKVEKVSALIPPDKKISVPDFNRGMRLAIAEAIPDRMDLVSGFHDDCHPDVIVDKVLHDILPCL